MIPKNLHNVIVEAGIESASVNRYGIFELSEDELCFIKHTKTVYSNPVVYGFLVKETNEIIYVGFSKNVLNRMRYYRQGNKRSTYHSDVKKTMAIIDQIDKGRTVEVFVYSIANCGLGCVDKVNSTLLEVTKDLEKVLIGYYKPPLNVQHIRNNICETLQ